MSTGECGNTSCTPQEILWHGHKVNAPRTRCTAQECDTPSHAQSRSLDRAKPPSRAQNTSPEVRFGEIFSPATSVWCVPPLRCARDFPCNLQCPPLQCARDFFLRSAVPPPPCVVLRHLNVRAIFFLQSRSVSMAFFAVSTPATVGLSGPSPPTEPSHHVMATSESTGLRRMSSDSNSTGLGGRLASIRSWPSDVHSAPAGKRIRDAPRATTSGDVLRTCKDICA